VLRKIIRRAIYHGRSLGANKPFMADMVHAVRAVMGDAYPELNEPTAARVPEIVLAEERRFANTLDRGLKEWEAAREQQTRRFVWEQLRDFLPQGQEIDSLFEDALASKNPEQLTQMVKQRSGEERALIFRSGWDTLDRLPMDGHAAFRLYDTYGLPLDFMIDLARDAGFEFDQRWFDVAMEEQRSKARASWKGGHKETPSPAFAKIAETFKTEKDFYQCTSAKDARIDAIIGKNGPTNQLKAGESGEVVLDRTPIYAESGGQVSDTGAFYDNSGTQLLAEVTGAYYPVAGLVAHKVNAKQTLRVGDRIAVVADADRRQRITRNHSGTHLVHAALRNILGTHVKQAGSLNSPHRLRFDFSHFAHVDAEELRDIEQQVNDEIRHNCEVKTDVTSIDSALASGALAFFGDKYPESNVRVVTIPDERAPRGFYSKELCGGTHVHRIGDIGVLKIVGEQSVAAGVRRIEAVTGIGALEHYQQQAQILTKVAGQLNVAEDAVLSTVEKLSQTVKQLEKELEAQKRKGALSQLDELFASAQTIKGVKFVIQEVPDLDKESQRQLVDRLRQKLGSGGVVLGTSTAAGAMLIAGVTKDLTAKVHAGKLIQVLAPKVGGKGGGRPDLAEAGGKDTSGLKSALQSVPSLLEPLL
jgi:alanyl-tRNA synthetase